MIPSFKYCKREVAVHECDVKIKITIEIIIIIIIITIDTCIKCRYSKNVDV